jgi:hypothetical protein
MIGFERRPWPMRGCGATRQLMRFDGGASGHSVRGLVVLCALTAGVAAWPAGATAELRTDSHRNPYLNHPDERRGTPANPVVQSARIRFDRSAGNIEAAIRFSTPIADPALTSALRPYWYAVTVGDFTGGICVGGERTWLRIHGRLGDPGKAELTRNTHSASRRPKASAPIDARYSPR